MKEVYNNNSNNYQKKHQDKIRSRSFWKREEKITMNCLAHFNKEMKK